MTGMTIQQIIIILTVLFALNCNSPNAVEGNTMDNSKQYKITVTTADTVLSAILYDNPTTRDFISLLPLDLKLDDYAGTEKISYLPRKLSTDDAPAGFDPSVGDITYYAPWGNLAIFYKDFGYANGLVHLGKIDKGVEKLIKKGSLNVTIKIIK